MDKNTKKKIILWIVYVVVLLCQIYTHFVYKFTYENDAYRIMCMCTFVFYCGTGLFFLILSFSRHANKKKVVAIFLVVMLVLQIITVMGTNYHGYTFPIIDARGSVYQYGILDPEVSPSQMLLFLSYYLDGKTLYATPKNDPRLFETGELFFEDEYEFVPKTTKILLNEETKYFLEENREDYYTLTVLPNYKLGTRSFFVHVYSAEDFAEYDEYMLYKDFFHNWYLIPKELRGKRWPV